MFEEGEAELWWAGKQMEQVRSASPPHINAVEKVYKRPSEAGGAGAAVDFASAPPAPTNMEPHRSWT